jgi:hypothetical protein
VRKKNPRRLILSVVGLGRRQAQKSLKLSGVTIDCGFKFLEHARNVVSKAKKAVGINFGTLTSARLIKRSSQQVIGGSTFDGAEFSMNSTRASRETL